MSTDTVANMITSIKNCSITKQKFLSVKATKVTKGIALTLLKEGFVKQVRELHQTKINRISLIITLRYRGRPKQPCITTIKQISKPGQRIYSNTKELPKVLGGIGIVILSTSQGIMSDKQARQAGLGGEIICSVW